MNSISWLSIVTSICVKQDLHIHAAWLFSVSCFSLVGFLV